MADGSAVDGISAHITEAAVQHAPTSLACLPPELLMHIFLDLSLADLASLSLVSRGLQLAVRLHGWSTWLEHSPVARRKQTLLHSRQCKGGGAEEVKALLAIDEAWKRKSFLARQIYFIDLPPPLGFAGIEHQVQRGGEGRGTGGKNHKTGPQRRKGDTHVSFQALSRQNQAMPILRLCQGGLLMALKSSLCFWPADLLHSRKGIKQDQPTVVTLHREGAAQKSLTAWEDISALQVIEHGPSLVVGRVDGGLEMWRWDEITNSQRSCPLLLASYKPESSTASSVQAISHLASHRLLAAAWKGGEVVVFELGNEPSSDGETASALGQGTASEPLCSTDKLRLVSSWTIDARPWSIHLGMTRSNSSPWLVIGCQGVDFLRLYRSSTFLCPMGARLEPRYTSLRVSSSTSPPVLSAYALASSGSDRHAAFPPHLLFAGCYDGLVRLWDLRQLDSEPVQEDQGTIATDRPSTLLPVQRFTDRYDPSPIYSLCLGVGDGSNSFAVGTARHGIVKLFEMGRDAQGTSQVDVGREWAQGQRLEGVKGMAISKRAPQEGMTIYPPSPPADFPTYTIVGEHGRLFSAGAGRLWEFDARGTLEGSGPSKEAEGEGRLSIFDGEATFSKRQEQYMAKGRWEVDDGSNSPTKEDAASAGTSVGWYYHGEMELKRSGMAREP